MRDYTTKLRDEALAREAAAKAGVPVAPDPIPQAAPAAVPAPAEPAPEPAMKPPQPTTIGPPAPISASTSSPQLSKLKMEHITGLSDQATLSTPVMERVMLPSDTPTPTPTVTDNSSKPKRRESSLRGGGIAFQQPSSSDSPSPPAMGTPGAATDGPVSAPAGAPNSGPVIVPRISKLASNEGGPSAVPAAQGEQPSDILKAHASQPRQRPVTPRLSLGTLNTARGAKDTDRAADMDGKVAENVQSAPDARSPVMPTAPRDYDVGSMIALPARPDAVAGNTSPNKARHLVVSPQQDMAAAQSTPQLKPSPPQRSPPVILPRAALSDGDNEHIGLSGVPELPDNAFALVSSLDARLQLCGYADEFCEGYMKGNVSPLAAVQFLQPAHDSEAKGTWEVGVIEC